MTSRELGLYRKKLGLNQTEMAKQLQTPYRTYVNWERGDRPIPGVCEVAVGLLLWKDITVMRAIEEKIARTVGGRGEQTVAAEQLKAEPAAG